MGSERVVPKIPVVELSVEHLKVGSDLWNSASQEVRKALEDYGYFELVYNKYSMEFHNKIIEALVELFNLPFEIKSKNTHPRYGFGYLPKSSTLSIHEGMGIEYATNKQECQNLTNLMWPYGNQHFCETLHAFANLVAEMLEVLVKMLCESYNIEKEYSESHIKSIKYLMRLMKYERLEGDINVGLRGHSDRNFLTILHQNHVKGLEIRTNDRDEWISYEPSSYSSFIVVAGDVCMAWSNDRIKSCYHRVMANDKEVRYSAGMFSLLNGLIKVPKELVDEEHPLKYKPFEQRPYFDFYNSSNDPNKSDTNMIKAFCGI
ncbi:2-oxoglutarate (2OG) and Fe(II)-dependent oxygenase superfamily protein [Euphorbia peplus]|nr:2-oxoglutarate (2OG) and Fe(II)-dependent oxygenase superfamily protein [Euphorbia peplus]